MFLYLSLLLSSAIGQAVISQQVIPLQTCNDPRCVICPDVASSNCLLCSQGYFLFTLPSYQAAMNLQAGAKVCVQCPYYGYSSTFTIYCGDCIEKAQTWESNRLCTYDYVIKNLDSSTGTYTQVFKAQNLLFYVVPILQSLTFNSVLVPNQYVYLQTSGCDGCSNFCSSASQTCFNVASQYKYDTNNLYISCLPGYAYNIVIQGCDACPSNCQSCNMITQRVITNGVSSITIVKQCLVCNTGFSLVQAYPKDGSGESTADQIIWCEPCMTGCSSCYFGRPQTSVLSALNLNSNPWTDVIANMPVDLTWPNQLIWLYQNQQVAQRCTLCTSPPSAPYIPSLNMMSCVRCLGQCAVCEYYSYQSVASLPQGVVTPTQSLFPVEPESVVGSLYTPSAAQIQAVEGLYQMRCRLCTDPSFAFTATGDNCFQCTITNCRICQKIDDPGQGGSPLSTLLQNFTPVTRESLSMESCVMCQPGYRLLADPLNTSGTKLICDPNGNVPTASVITGCTTYDKNNLCVLCNIGYTLMIPTSGPRSCSLSCLVNLGDFFCLSCIGIQNTGIFSYRCLQCTSGFFVDFNNNGKCTQCDSTQKCGTCTAYTMLAVQQPILVSQPNSVVVLASNAAPIDSALPVLGPVCSACISTTYTLNPYTKKCESCGAICSATGCVTQAIVTYCGQCVLSSSVPVSRSVNTAGNDCIICPDNSSGCRERTAAEIAAVNPYFNPSVSAYNQYSRISYQCSTPPSKKYFYDAAINRCVDCSTTTSCQQTISITIKAQCLYTPADTLTNPVQIQYYFRNQTQSSGTIMFDTIETAANYLQWNQVGAQIININLIFQRQTPTPTSFPNSCFFSKTANFTTAIKQNVFSIQEINLKILAQTPDDPTNPIIWYIQQDLIFEYFTTVSISGIYIQPAWDLNYQGQAQANIYQSPFSIKMSKNQGAKFMMDNVVVQNYIARQYYQGLNDSLGGNPYVGYRFANDTIATNLKKYTPFNTFLLNVYQISITNCVFYSLNYLISGDLSFHAYPFYSYFKDTVPNLQFTFQNVSFYDTAFEQLGLIQYAADTKFSQVAEWNSKAFISQVQFIDAYFVNQAGLVVSAATTTPIGMIFYSQILMQRAIFNNSYGLAYVQTAQQLNINGFTLLDSFVNDSAIVTSNTMTVNDIYVKNTTFTYGGRVLQSSQNALYILTNSFDYSGLKMNLNNLQFDTCICLTPACFIQLTNPVNPYDLPLNVTIFQLSVTNVISNGFDPTTITAATSATIQVSTVYQFQLKQFESYQNANLTILYTEKAQVVVLESIYCLQAPGLTILNNYCVSVNNFYRSVLIDNVVLNNLKAQDNSFIAVSSWNNIIYNTTYNGVPESVTLRNFVIQNNTVTTTVLALMSSSIVIDSTQQQIISITNLYFLNNKHLQLLKATLQPSNPTIVMSSPVGTLSMSSCQWISNRASGFGAVAQLQVGIMSIDSVSFVNSNYDPLHLNTTDPAYVPINNVSNGGHAFIGGYQISLTNSNFTNSSACNGAGIYIQTLMQGILVINNTNIQYALTPLDGSVVSSGGCIYIDSSQSQLSASLGSLSLTSCSVRAYGGGIYLKSSDKSQTLTLQNSSFTNCYALSGGALKFVFEGRTRQPQIANLINVEIVGNFTDALNFFSAVTPFSVVEQFLFIKRSGAIEQDYGQLSISNNLAEGLYFVSYISLVSPMSLKINGLSAQHSKISYRPMVEVIEPLLNPIVIYVVTFMNITVLNSTVNCSNASSSNELTTVCQLLQIRVNFPDYSINPALMALSTITPYTPINMTNIVVSRVNCSECLGGLVQVIGISTDILTQLVYLSVSRCSDSISSYLGCFAISSQSSNTVLASDIYLNYSYQSNLTAAVIENKTGLAFQQLNTPVVVTDGDQDESTTTTIDFKYAVPNPPWLAHVAVIGLTVQNVSSVHGGGVYLHGVTANVTNMYCTEAIVRGEGGCIYYSSTPKQGSIVAQRLNLYNNVFYKNNASIGGAIRVKESGVNNPNNASNSFVQNFASMFGNNVAGYPSRMGVSVGGTLQTSSFLSIDIGWLHYPLIVKSGQIMKNFNNQDIVFLLMDDNNKPMNYQYDQTCKMTSSVSQAISGNAQRTFAVSAQGFNYSDLTIIFDPYQNITLDIVISSPIVNIPEYSPTYPFQLLGFDISYVLQARVRSVECARGEAYDATAGTCTPCSEGTYVLDYKGLCKQLNADSMNYTQRNKISLYYGYWRPDHYNDLAEYCKNKPINCVGGLDAGNDLCIEGMIGALCESCDIYNVYWGQTYSVAAKYQCGSCGAYETNVIMIVILSIWTVISTILSVKGNQEKMQLVILTDVIAAFGWSSSQQAGAEVAVMMKMLTNHLQILSFLQEFQIQVPVKAVNAVNTVSMPAKTVGNSLDCFLVSNTWGIDLLYFRLIWSLIMQIIYILAILLIMAVAVLLGKLVFKIQYLYTMAIFLFLLLQPNYVMEFMLLISSRTISGIKWVQANVAYQYDTNTHQQWVYGFGIPGLLTWVVILPLIFCYVIFQGAQQDKLDSFFFSQSWGFLYHEYRRNRYYWEFVKIYLRTLLVVLTVYFEEDVVVKGILAFLVVYLYYGLSNHFNPFQARQLNDIDTISTVVLALSLVIGVFLYRTIQINFLSLTVIGVLVIGFLNAIFFLVIIYNLLKGYLKQFAPALDNVIDILNEKFPQLAQNPRLRPYMINRTKMNLKVRKLWTMVSKVVSIGIDQWKRDNKLKPLTFERLHETFIEDKNRQFNEDLREIVHNRSEDESRTSKDGSDDHHSLIFQQNDVQEEGKDQYEYQ